MPTAKYSKGYKKKPGSTPPQAPPSSPSRQSGGTSGNLTIPHYTPSTPTVPYNPSGPPTPVQQQIRRETATPSPSTSTGNPLADQYLLSRLVDLVTPGPTAAELAQAASTLGVKPKAVSAGVSAAAEGVSSGIKELGKDVAEGVKAATKLPDHRVVRAFGHKTLGTPTIAQLTSAERKGQLRVNQKGKLTIPATRHALHEFHQAKEEFKRHAVPEIQGISNPDQREFAQWLSFYSKLPPKLAGEWALQEGGGWGSDGVSGGEAGEQNWLGVGYPAEPTPFSRSHYFNNTTPKRAAKATAEWMEGKIGGEYDYTAAPSIQKIPQLARAGATEQQIREYIEGPSAWGTGAIVQSGITVNGGGGVPPAVAKQFEAARDQLVKLGITPPTGQKQPQMDYLKVFGQQVGRELKLVQAGKYDQGKGTIIPMHGSSDVSTGHEPEIAARLKLLSAKLGQPVYIISGYRTPQHSVEVGGFADDPHTKGEAADIGVGAPTLASAAAISEADYESVGLYRPFGTARGGSSTEDNHVQLLNGGTPATGTGGGGSSAPSVGGAAPVGGGGGGSAVAAAALAGGGGAAAKPRPPMTVSLGQVPVSSLLNVHSPLPRAFQQFELGEAPEEEANGVDEGVIARILRGRRN